MTQRRFLALDALRGIAALMVAAAHFDSIVLDRLTWNRHIGLCVDFFFILSGFVIARAYEPKILNGMSFTAYALVRLKRLYPLIALGAVLGFVAVVIGAHRVAGAGTFLAAQLLFVPTLWLANETFRLNNVQWSLFVELFVNGLHHLTASALTNAKLFIVILVSAILLFVSVKQHGESNLGWISQTFAGGLVRGVFGFAAGLLLFRLSASGRLPRIRIHWTLVFAALPILNILASYRWGWRWYADPMIVVFILPMLCWVGAICRVPQYLEKTSALLGRLSYPVYSIHIPIVFVAGMLHRNPTGMALPDRLETLVWMAIIVAAAYAATVLFDDRVQAFFARSTRRNQPRDLETTF